jgi:hypothetical protein
MSFDRARAIADAVLLEGYVLYPYRASSRKNQFRWAFGVLSPRTWSEAGGCEPWWMEAQCPVELDGTARIAGRLRFLQIEARRIEAVQGDTMVPVPSLNVDGRLLIPWEEGRVHEVDFDLASDGDRGCIELPVQIPGGERIEEVRDSKGQLAGRIVWETRPLIGVLRGSLERVGERLAKLCVRVENLGTGVAPGVAREIAVRCSLVSAHVMMHVNSGAFVSLLDPPEWAHDAARGCRSTGCHPVLAGPPGARDLVLAAPIILYDHPQIAPESQSDLCDATEIDEILTLRTLALTEDEKVQARATDPRAAAIVDHAARLPVEHWEKLHGAVRDLHRGEMVPRSCGVTRGSRVRLRPDRRTDAQDLLFAGCTATVEAVVHDVDGRSFVAVTLDDDPAADLHRWYGRFHYYGLDEIEPIASAEGRS